MKICIVVDNLNPSSGWGRLALKAAEGFRIRGHTVGFIVGKEGAESNAPKLVVPLRLSSLNLLRLPVTLSLIRNFIKDYDIILCYDVNPNAIILNMANLGQKKKVVVHALATYSLLGKRTPIRNLFMRWAYHRAKKVLVVSDFTKRQIEKGDFRLKESVIVPVGVDTDFFHSLPTGNRILPYPFILTVGALKHRKGYHLSIPAFGSIAQEFPELKYVIIGDQGMRSYYQKMKNLVRELNLNDRVLFFEKVDDKDLIRYYNDAKLFVLTSVTEPDTVEGFGMVYLEANACGIPTIGAQNSGAEAAIVNSSTGILVKHDPKDIADAMKKILTDEEFARTLGNNGIQWAHRFSWPNVVQAYLDNF